MTEAVIPQVGSAAWTTRTPFGAPGVCDRDFRENLGLLDHLRREVNAGRGEVAVHGVTHLDHALTPQRPRAEFEILVDHHLERLLRESRRLRDELGASYFAPPHNVAHPDVVRACHDAGFDVCRSLTRDEVLQAAGADRRDDAKALHPYRWRGARLEAFQTILLSKRRLRRHGRPAAGAACGVAAVAARAGVAIITIHWWDFASDAEGSWDPWYGQWMQRFLAALESQLAMAGRTPVYCTLSGLRAALQSERTGPRPAAASRPAMCQEGQRVF